MSLLPSFLHPPHPFTTPLEQGASMSLVVVVTPLFFGAAHFHHLHDLLLYQGASLKSAVSMVLVQYAYTTLFGCYATWLFLRTGSLVSPVVAHVACNWMGLPNLTHMVAVFGRPLTVLLTTASVMSFWWLMQPMTEPALFGGPWRITRP
ncbi:hypothetical protein QJQ45_005668 [Haematococcus lacustris]|nr:hypothetical protein QJQ45_005668 [Haematococcus lacustris]